MSVVGMSHIVAEKTNMVHFIFCNSVYSVILYFFIARSVSYFVWSVYYIQKETFSWDLSLYFCESEWYNDITMIWFMNNYETLKIDCGIHKRLLWVCCQMLYMD